ncbi:MAG TPA: hypothetical protein VFH73_12060 [Polyangia bacterium]|jgi:hypothetical protein|nr:hypothetical protein [Polyangia bacterium]
MSLKLAYISLLVVSVLSFCFMGSGCGLISSDIASVSFDLPSKSYSFDTNNGMWKLPMGMFPAIPCGDGQLIMDCCNPPDPLPKPNCAATPLTCEGAPSVCTLRFPVSVVQSMDLKKEVPALATFSNQSIIKVTISQIRYTFDSTMNVDLPEVELFLAPDGVTAADDPSAQKFGTVPVTPAMMSGQAQVVLEMTAATIFAERSQHLGTPFNFIATTTVVVPSGTTIPSGGVNLTVTGRAKASL